MGLSVLLFFDSCRYSYTMIMCNSTMDSASCIYCHLWRKALLHLEQEGIKEIERLGYSKGCCFTLVFCQTQPTACGFLNEGFSQLNVIRAEQITFEYQASQESHFHKTIQDRTLLHLGCLKSRSSSKMWACLHTKINVIPYMYRHSRHIEYRTVDKKRF